VAVKKDSLWVTLLQGQEFGGRSNSYVISNFATIQFKKLSISHIVNKMKNINLSSILLALCVFTYALLITFLPSLDFMPNYIYFHDSQRLYQLLLLALVLLHALFNKAEYKINFNTKMRSAIFLLIGLASISTLMAKSLRHATIEVSIFAGLAYLAIFVANLFNENKTLLIKWLNYAIWVSVILYLLSFYVGYFSAIISNTPLHWPSPFNGFNNIRAFNQYQLWPIALITLPLLTLNIKKSTQLWLYFALSCWWVLLFYSASRGVLLAWLAGVVITAIIYQKYAWQFLRIQFVNIVTGFAGYYLLFKYIPSSRGSTVITSTIARESTSDRTDLWIECMKFIQENPIFGIGPMNAPWHHSKMLQPHNSLLQLASEWGLPATFIILAIAGYGIYQWLKKFNSKTLENQSSLDKNLAVILFFTITTNAAYSLVDGVIVMPISQVLMFTIIGLMIGHYTHSSLTISKENFKISRFKFGQGFAALTLIALIWSTLPEIIQGLSGYERGFSMGPNTINPRIWLQMR
jgi:putative inorganic carbon (hco3(-)) transporter